MKPRKPHPAAGRRRPRPPVQPRPGGGGGPRRHRAGTEEMFHGLRACEALFARRPEAIIRVYVAEPRRRQFASLLEWCARKRKGFQVVGDDSLERLTGSIHHEGIAILAQTLDRWDLARLLGSIEAGRLGGPLVYLDGVQNPHNLGSILRTAAHFGAGAIVGREGELPPLSPAAVRVAEGAAEFVPVCDLVEPVTDLGRLRKAGYRIVATSSHAGAAVQGAGLGGRTVLVLGSEGEGISRAIDAVADLRVQIPGTGAVESLNVSVACGIVLAEAWRQGGHVGPRA